MHAKPDLRVFLKWMINRSGSVITDVITLMKQFSLTSVLCLIASVAAVLAMAVANFSPQLYKQATSPDGSWSVQVHRCQTFPMFNVDVIVTELLEDGTVLFNDRIDRRDLWEDVDGRYPDVICENDEIRLGPGYWDVTKLTYFTIKKE